MMQIFTIKTIRWKLLTYYFLLFIVFFTSIILYQTRRERHFKIAELETTLNEHTDITNRFILYHRIHESGDYRRIDSLKSILPPDKIRITVLSKDGKVLYDNRVYDFQSLENHLKRPEVQKALLSEFGESIRLSSSTNDEYFYFAKQYDTIVIRAAVVYNARIKEFLESDRVFIPIFILIFAIFGFFLLYIANHIGDSIEKLKEFTLKIKRDEKMDTDENIRFSNDELGFISKEIISLYQQLKKTKTELVLEKEKLISHLNILKEGIAFFSPTKKRILNNSHFIHYINILLEEATISDEGLFITREFEEINNFINRNSVNKVLTPSQEISRFETRIKKNNYYFRIQCILFPDNSFEILIIDQTQQERRSIMKQQITSNISHELKTPIASVKGYLETILHNRGLSTEKQLYFIDKAHHQTERLTQLVNDISLLNKIEEYSELYPREQIKIVKSVNEALEGFKDLIQQKNIMIECEIPENMVVTANSSLVFSVFRNLIENAIHYGGSGITIAIACYHQDQDFCYFTFSDNGPGVDEEHLNRLFERFYRVDTGRSRKEGGTGLGLAIVKNAILSLKGEISARNRKEGGLEFLFSIPI